MDSSAVTELEQLAAETPRDTHEYFRANDNYGHASLVKRYCGLPHEYPLPGIYPHGYYLAGRVYPKEAMHPLPFLLLYSRMHQAHYARSCSKRSFVIGAPIYYARALIADEVARLRASARGSVVFPIHSTPHLTLHDNQAELIHRLQALPAEFQPVSVCLYYRDVQLGRHRPFLEAGFDCYTAGHRYHRDFLLRVVRILAPRRYVIANEISTPFVNGPALGLTARLLSQALAYEGRNKHLRDIQPPESPEGHALLATAQMPPEEAGPRQRELAEEIFGWADFPSPEQLRAQLEALTPEAARAMQQWNRPWNRAGRAIVRLFRPKQE